MPRIQPIRGLNDLKAAFDANNNVEARAIIKEIVVRSILERQLAGNVEGPDLVKLTPEELQEIDPDNNFPELRVKAPNDGRVSIVWKRLLINLIEMYKSTKP